MSTSHRVVPTRHLTRLAACSLLVVSALACTDQEPLAAPNVAEAAFTRAEVDRPESGIWRRVVEGETRPGARYALYVPRHWNGDAVYMAHGFRDAESPVDLRDQDSLYLTRDSLGARGYAVAYSSYSQNGFAVKDGAQSTHQLRGLLRARLPRRVRQEFIIGHSLGGGIGLDLVQRFGRQYNGALLVCGMVGGSQLETDYLGNVRALFDAFYPGALPGNVLGVPAGTEVTIGQITAAVGANPAALFAIASTLQTPLPYLPIGDVANPATPAFQTLVGSLYGALSFHARGINNIVDLVNGTSPFGNRSTVYSLATQVGPFPIGPLVAASNDLVTRYDMDRRASNYLSRHFTPTGNLSVPVLTLHNTWDPAVPLFHEAALKSAVDAAGNSAFLVQRQVPTYGHCNISATMVLEAFSDLSAWAASGVKP